MEGNLLAHAQQKQNTFLSTNTSLLFSCLSFFTSYTLHVILKPLNLMLALSQDALIAVVAIGIYFFDVPASNFTKKTRLSGDYIYEDICACQ